MLVLKLISKFNKNPDKERAQGFKYIIFGVLTTVVNISVYYILSKFNVHYLLNNTASFIISVVFAFLTNKIYVFESKSLDNRVVLSEILKFSISRIATFSIDSVLMIIFIDLLNINEMFSKIFVNAVVIICNYFMSKLFVFSNKENI